MAKRSDDVRLLIEEKREIRKDIRTGRTLLEIEERIEELEVRLGLSRPVQQPNPTTQNEPEDTIGNFKDWSAEWDQDVVPDLSEDETFDHQDASSVPSGLRRNAEQYLVIKLLQNKIGPQHPFLLSLQERVDKLKETIARALQAVARAENDAARKQRIIQLRTRLDHD